MFITRKKIAGIHITWYDKYIIHIILQWRNEVATWNGKASFPKLYTGMTRAKNRLIILGNKQTINFMINNVNTKKRNTGLKYKLENM